MAAPRLPVELLRFLRGLKANNRREWFEAHREQYERFARAPMIAFIERLAHDFRVFAPELEANSRVSLYRIHRDIRFSANKAPYKTHVAAVFPCRVLSKHDGACLYFHVSPDEAWVGGGMYAPGSPELHAVREHIAMNLKQLLSLVESPAFRRVVGPLHGERLQRVPRGFPKDHPAAEYLRYRQFLVGRELPPLRAVGPRFYATVLTIFRHVAALVRFLNEPLVAARRERLAAAPAPLVATRLRR